MLLPFAQLRAIFAVSIKYILNMYHKPINIDLINTLFKKSAEASENLWEWRYRVHSSLLIVSSTMFAVVVSLPIPLSDNCCIAVRAYLAALVLNALCVLLFGGLLYIHIRMRTLYLRRLGEHIRAFGETLKQVGNGFFDDTLKAPAGYVLLKNISYTVFPLTIFAYTVLGWLRA